MSVKVMMKDNAFWIRIIYPYLIFNNKILYEMNINFFVR